MKIKPSDLQLIRLGLKKELKYVDIKIKYVDHPLGEKLSHLQEVKEEILNLLQLVNYNQHKIDVVSVHRFNAVTGLSIC
jgi:hypothetical protein